MIEDTSKRHPLQHLVEAQTSGMPTYILRQEGAGQGQLLNSTKIPTQGPVDQLVEWGFKLGPVDPDDPIFRECELPEGWKREGSDHSMWSYIVDEHGYRRVAIFYKAAFYDRSAHFHVERLPRTRAQADAWEKADPGHEKWRGGDSYRDGANFVYVFNGRYGDRMPPPGKNSYSDDGRRLEVVIAPDGGEVSRREYTTEPIEERW